jgi:hypothetical protein
VGQFLA